jgi:hypothetical protein
MKAGPKRAVLGDLHRHPRPDPRPGPQHRIVSNLLPATGPVSVAGDQGRDAESHWTDLPATTSWFAVLASTDSVVLACTIHKRDVAGKIRRDLSTITAAGTQVNRVIYFTVTAVPIALRHELQMDARATHGIELDIWDAQPSPRISPTATFFTWPSIICTL